MKVLKGLLKFIMIVLLVILILITLLVAGIYFYSEYKDKEYERYSGHGFAYMRGFSTTDFTGYHVYDGDKLVSLDHEAALQIEDIAEMPVWDGAEACYPVYTAIAKAIYKDIGAIEQEVVELSNRNYSERSEEENEWICHNGRVVTFTNSLEGYYRLIYREADLFMGTRPSANQLAEAEEEGVQIVSIPVGKEAFVFFVEEDALIDDISSDDLRKIYAGEITNWQQVGGEDQKIVAFQRPEDSGSQVMMRYFMGDTELMEADTISRVSGMGDMFKAVKQYHNEAGAIGYTFRYFLEELHQEEGIKILSVDGVYPSIENIKNGSYPLCTELVISRLADNDKENVDKVIDFVLSPDGQYIIENTGYAPINEGE